MHLKYMGKKQSVTVNIPGSSEKIVFEKSGPAIRVRDSFAQSLMAINPKMFSIVAENEADCKDKEEEKSYSPFKPISSVIQPDQESEQDPVQILKCSKCGREFQRQHFFDKHILTCSGAGEDQQ